MKKILLLVAIVGISRVLSAQTTMMATPNQFISLDSANKMIQSYLYSIASTDSNLYSVIVDADALRLLLANQNIKNVKISLAHTLPYINAGNKGRNCGYKQNQLTFILSAFDANNDYIYTGGRVLDNVSPCPPLCPAYGTASQNIFPN